MTTRRWSVAVGVNDTDVVEAAGIAVVTGPIEITADCASTVVYADGTTRKMTREEFLSGLENIKTYVMRNNWPPV